MRFTKTGCSDLGRRRFIKAGLLATSTSLLHSRNSAANSREVERRLSFYHIHTGESLDLVYRDDRGYLDGALVEINHVLRDHRVNQTYPIDPELLDLLYDLRATLASASAFHVISCYRSPMTNASLAARSEGVAKGSLHMRGKAIDIRLPGCELVTLRRTAVALRLGGVGYYPRPDFVHVDTGRVRHW